MSSADDDALNLSRISPVGRSITSPMVASCAVFKRGITDFGQYPGQHLSRDCSFGCDRMAAHLRENGRKFARTCLQLKFGERCGDRGKPRMLAHHKTVRAAEKRRVERLVGTAVLEQTVNMNA